MANVHTVRIYPRGKAPRPDHSLLHEAQKVLGVKSIVEIRKHKTFRIEGLDSQQVEVLASELLADPVAEEFTVNATKHFGNDYEVEVGYKPGVMNPEAEAMKKAAELLGFKPLATDLSFNYQFSFTEKGAPGVIDARDDARAIIHRLLVNPTTQQIIEKTPETLLITGTPGPIEVIPIRSMSDAELLNLSSDRKMYLNLEEMRVIRAHYIFLDRDAYDDELEKIAQVWSEHCGHKTFKAALSNGNESLIQRIKEASREVSTTNILSAFEDNSGVMAFYDDNGVSIKVETHNSPSAAEPYGGAATGVGGVLRDPVATGLGMKVIGSMDVFCLAPPTLPNDQVPPGCLHPEYLLQRIVAGVRDYGNRMGVPTNNGSVYFHEDYKAKPTVLVGAVGIAPSKYCKKGEAQFGDAIILLGGRTGRDGIHGATFSSAEMTAETSTVHSTSVQIGHAIEEKRTFDALLACRDAGLNHAITDCGAGGISSAISEMGEKTGAHVTLEKVPTKYEGLAPWEIDLSESQERMVAAVAQQDTERFIQICESYNVEATVIGTFDSEDREYPRYINTYNGEVCCDLSMEFLHHGLPQRNMIVKWVSPEIDEIKVPRPATAEEWIDRYERVMSHGNVCSKEPIVRQYDHTVQGTNALAPFTGENLASPNDGAVIRPILDKPYGLIITHGMDPVLNKINPYKGAKWAWAEALANLVAVGGNPAQGEVAMVNNYITATPDEHTMGVLDMMVDAVCDAMRATKAPVISGKDSLSSRYRFPDGSVLDVPPVLCITAMGRIPDVSKTISSDFKRTDSVIVLVGYIDSEEMGGSVYYDVMGGSSGAIPNVELNGLHEDLLTLSKAIATGKVLACHDISHGGMAAALAEMCFGGGCGATVDIYEVFETGRPDHIFFQQAAGAFLVEIMEEDIPVLEDLAVDIIGRTAPEKVIRVDNDKDHLFSVEVERLLKAWRRPMQEVFA